MRLTAVSVDELTVSQKSEIKLMRDLPGDEGNIAKQQTLLRERCWDCPGL
jgi:hypothetical protein